MELSLLLGRLYPAGRMEIGWKRNSLCTGNPVVSSPESAGKKWVLDQESFDRLLLRLDPDRDRAAERYELIRRKLVRFFDWRGCTFPEDYADRTINRVAKKILEGVEIHTPDAGLYFLGVARMVFREFLKEARQERETFSARAFRSVPPPGSGERATAMECLTRCLRRLPADAGEMLLQYYEGGRGTRIRTRSELARQMRIPLNALRIRAHRARAKLEECIRQCLDRSERT